MRKMPQAGYNEESDEDETDMAKRTSAMKFLH